MYGTEDPVSLDTICTCKECEHDRAEDCAKIGCNCCKGSSHSMVMDGIEGFGLDDRGRR